MELAAFEAEKHKEILYVATRGHHFTVKYCVISPLNYPA